MTEDPENGLPEGEPDNQPKSEDQADTYSVGYGRPPAHSRWRKGQSGNPRGRKKGEHNLHTVVRREIGETIQISEAGKPKRITKLEAVVKSLMAHSIKGNPRHTTILLAVVKELPDQDLQHAKTLLSPKEQAAIDAFLRRNPISGDEK